MASLTFDINIIGAAVNDYLTSKLSFDTIGKKYKMTGGNVRHWVIKLGYKPRKIHDARIDHVKMKECCDLYLKGFSNKTLSIKYNVSKRTILDWLKKANITPQKLSERMGISQELKEKAKGLYLEQKLNCAEISKIIGVSSRSILDWVGKDKRSQSEISAISILKGTKKPNCYGKKGNIETRFGLIHFDSLYERDRIIQLNSDVNIIKFSRCKDYIKYTYNGIEKRYLPDFFIEYSDGKIIVEEIKPSALTNSLSNPEKFKEAISFYKEKNISFRVITELEIYGKKSLKFLYKKKNGTKNSIQ